MILRHRNLIVLTAMLLLSATVHAHVAMVYPAGGESFRPGETVTVEWEVVIDHGPNNWDLSFSDDGGMTWTVVATDLPKPTLTYDWVVPGLQSDQARLKIVQDNQEPNNDYQYTCQSFTIAVDYLPSGSLWSWAVLVLVLIGVGFFFMRRRRTV